MKTKAAKGVQFVLLLALILVFLYPIVFVFLNSLKTNGEIISNPLALPQSLQFRNFLNAWSIMDIPKLMRNTALLTVGGLVGIVLISTMVAYWCNRYPSRFSNVFSKLLVGSMLIPFASIMLPLVQVTKVMHLNNSIPGVTLVYWGLGLAFSYFIIQGAVKSVPYELEEAALIDGCGPIRTFWLVVFPLLKNAVISVVVMDVFWLWNDFMTQLILLNNPKYETLQIGINRMFGVYSSKWDIALPTLVWSMLPILIIFVVLNRKIVDGIASGAVKG